MVANEARVLIDSTQRLLLMFGVSDLQQKQAATKVALATAPPSLESLKPHHSFSHSCSQIFFPFTTKGDHLETVLFN